VAASIIPFPQPATAQASTSSRRRITQAQADRIVAQVETEIAHQAYRHHRTGASTLYVLPTPKPESTTSIARRILTALLTFGKSA
jgi:hypothetical protein